jgi:anti-sigma factor RsiW
MSDDRSAADDMRCIDFVEAISPYLDGDVDDERRRRMDAHLLGCMGCRAAIDQFQTVIALTGRLSPEDVADIDPLTRDRLMATLRTPRRR